MRDLTDELKGLRGRLDEAAGYLKVDELRARRPQLEAEASRPDLWDDPDKARQVTSELAAVNDDIGAFEVNEAFAPVPMAWLKDLGADEKALNPNGGAIALGHPLGGSGARLMTTLVHHMKDNGIRYGLQTMCEGGGMANATILELL